jgi:hypothetical protein
MKRREDEILIRISKLLMLHGSFVGNLGLMHGKMGMPQYVFARCPGKTIADIAYK